MVEITFSTSGVRILADSSYVSVMRTANADAPCCSRDFMSLTIVSPVLAMSIALSSLNLSSFPKRSCYIFHSRVPIIIC